MSFSLSYDANRSMLDAMAKESARQKACRSALAECDVLRHDALVEETIPPEDALEKMSDIIDRYLDEHEGGAW